MRVPLPAAMITTSNAVMLSFLRLSRIIRHALLLGSLFLLGGCSTLRLAYNQSEDLVYWWLDRHADFTAEQKPQVREALADLHQWHRQHQLPEYIALLQKARSMAPRDVTSEQICVITHEMQASYVQLLRHVEPAAARIVAQLKPEQLRKIRQRYDKINEDWRDEWLEGPADKRLRLRVKNALNRLEDFYGPLDTAQRETVQQWVAGSGFDPMVSYAERERRQADSLQTFQRMAQEGGANAAPLLRGWVDRSFSSPVPKHRDYSQAVWQANCEGFARLHNSTTPEQRQRLANALLGYENDLRAVLKR
jgi:hypothetical protein